MTNGTMGTRETAAEDPTEREAARLAREGTPLERAAMALRAAAALLRDPDDTRQIFYVGLVVNRRTYPRFLARLTEDDEGARLLRERPAIDSTAIDYGALRALPDGTLGREYVRFLDAHGLDPDLFQAPPGLPEVPAYIGKRMRQVHDLWHVLTGYGPDVRGEIALQAFTWAQTGMASAMLVTLGGSARFGLRDPRVVGGAIEGYRRGSRARFLPSLRIEDWLARPLDEVRRELRIEPLAA